MWPIPQSLCDANPELSKYGLYRKLSDGTWEMIPYCGINSGPRAGHSFYSVYDSDLDNLLDGTLPKE